MVEYHYNMRSSALRKWIITDIYAEAGISNVRSYWESFQYRMQAQSLELTWTYCILSGSSDKWTHLQWEPASAFQGAAEMTMKRHMASDEW